MQATQTFVITEPKFITPPLEKKSSVAHACQEPGALHFYASDVCIFCHEHREPWTPKAVGGVAATPST